MRLIYSTLLLVFFSSVSFAKEGDYLVYKCQTIKAANSCSDCEKIKKVSITFKVQPINNTVLYTTYRDGVEARTDTFDNCKVIDANNWHCQLDGQGYSFEQTMTDGVYKSVTLGNELRVSCGKKSSLFNFFDK